jgi:hypothetical protein
VVIGSQALPASAGPAGATKGYFWQTVTQVATNGTGIVFFATSFDNGASPYCFAEMSSGYTNGPIWTAASNKAAYAFGDFAGTIKVRAFAPMP